MRRTRIEVHIKKVTGYKYLYNNENYNQLANVLFSGKQMHMHPLQSWGRQDKVVEKAWALFCLSV